MVCINPAYRVFELEYALNKSGCKAIIAAEQFKSSHYLEMLQKLAPELEDCSSPGSCEQQNSRPGDRYPDGRGRHAGHVQLWRSLRAWAGPPK